MPALGLPGGLASATKGAVEGGKLPFDPGTLLTDTFLGGGLPSLSSSSSASSVSVSGGTFQSGAFNPVFGSDPTAIGRAVDLSIPLLGAGLLAWVLLKK